MNDSLVTFITGTILDVVAVVLLILLICRTVKRIRREGIAQSQKNFIYLILILSVASLAYRLLVYKQLEQTALLFIGIPTLIAVIVSVCFKMQAKSLTGLINIVITKALLLSFVVLGEGAICILMSAPLFYLVGTIIGKTIEFATRKNNKIIKCVAIVPFVLMSFEGAVFDLSFNRSETVSFKKIVNLSKNEVLENLALTPNFDQELPFFFKLGFPKPVKTQGQGLEVGSIREIDFAGGEGSPGTLSLFVSEVSSDKIQFKTLEDTSHIAHWLDWKNSTVYLKTINNQQTEITWEVEYTRLLDPAWYFAPWERFGVKIAAEYLIDSLIISPSSNVV